MCPQISNPNPAPHFPPPCSVQAMSGAQLNVSPGAAGLFNLVIMGGKAQVEIAKNLMGTVIGNL